ncbi:NAD(P)-dependent oxidoreductase [Mycobacteroides abscessus]
MKLLVLGATGPTGRLVVERALACGDDVTVVVRRPEALGTFAGQVRVQTGDATSAADLTAALAGQDAAISALGRGTSIRADGLFTKAAAAVIAAAQHMGLRRLVWMSSFGVGDTYAAANLMQKFMYSTMLRDIYADKKIAEQAIRASGLEWTLVYPTALTNGPASGAYRVGERLDMPLAARVSRADVADFLHTAAHSPEWIRRDAVITG